ncbi:MAG: UvrD-helicase domain-containing protein [Magnetococcales bacterium]|nr:UvrD-helicase domain-containing protein [Magnetococcales bacterium]
MGMVTLKDQAARAEALDIHRSFIVQAPAGSGKTGLLTQRVLALLGQVEQPEEIVAITFTRKAAAEMKDRVLKSLSPDAPPSSPFEEKTWQLAQVVLERDRQRQWRLRENPNRLQIMTIDALCHSLVRQLPILTELGGKGILTDDPESFYRQAARDTLDVFDDDVAWQWAVVDLFKHLDNDWDSIEAMLAALLSRRDQWLRHVAQGVDEALLHRLNDSLAAMIRVELAALKEMMPRSAWSEIAMLMDFSRTHRTDDQEEESPWIGRLTPPGIEVTDIILWQQLADTLLTQAGTWRRRWDARSGFPPKSKANSKVAGQLWEEMKQRISSLVEQLGTVDELDGALNKVRRLPQALFSEQQWHILQALLTLLKVAAGNLMVQFASREAVDHVEVARRAIMALGAVDDPSDLALRLDYRIRHLLVDEFQDTSRLQFELLERLVAGWTPDQGNTLFLVGDPMQSIYRFREAEVGLFLKVQQRGLGPVATVPLFLEVNFRSLPGIVDWVNDSMMAAFPKMPRPETGAVEFKRSRSASTPEPGMAVVLTGCDNRDDEAYKTAEMAENARKRGQSVCILARTRNHLAQILPALDARGLRYQAVELHPLARRSVIQDLLALTRALIHPGDRIAWLALLRAPWCGLSLSDLHAIVQLDPKAPLRDGCNHPQVDAVVSPLGKAILDRVRPILNTAWMQRGEWSAFPGPGALRRWVEGTWRQLGGPATLFSPRHWEDAKSFFDLLERLEGREHRLDTQILEQEVASLFSNIDPRADPGLVVMTIHKAKGLEFDCVIIPGLDRRPRPDSARLLLWTDPPMLAGSDADADLAPLLAPIGRWDGNEGDPIYQFVQSIEQEKLRNEVCRLLYVALTRAKKHLFLLGLVQDAETRPAVGSFLSVLWSSVAESFVKSDGDATPDEEQPVAVPLPVARRLPADWTPPAHPPWPQPVVAEKTVMLHTPVVFDWVGSESRLVGIVIHRFLARMAMEGVDHWSTHRIEQHRGAVKNHLLDLGMSQNSISARVDQVIAGLNTVLASAKGRWLLDPNHREARSEWGVTGVIDQRMISVVIDRSFVDHEGCRWIVDFKTSRHEGGDREGFLANEVLRYQQQLDLYARLISTMEQRPIRLGLYFPLMDAWREWAWTLG